jgi:hypothetical protein
MLARIRDMDRLVELAVGIAEIQNVHAFRCLVVPCLVFGPTGSPPSAT